MNFNASFNGGNNSFNASFDNLLLVSGIGETYILVDEAGTEVVGVLVSHEQVFDATANDIRIGKTAATEDGVTIGEKEIPAYHTVEGTKAIPNGGVIELNTPNYNYSELQCIICNFNSSLANSVSAEKVAIGDKVYDVKSTVVLSTITKEANDTTGAIKFNIVNTSGKPYVLRYIFYEEIY